MAHPILFTFRRCPYAIRARLALHYAQIKVNQVEIDLKNKAPALLHVSPKGTVPVLVVNEQLIITESIEIMYWVLRQHDPDGWLNPATETQAKALIQDNDFCFKPTLDNYKYSHNRAQLHLDGYRKQAHPYLSELNLMLQKNRYLLGPKLGLVDSALLPFIRQFYMVDKSWFEEAKYPYLRNWLNDFLISDLFKAVMAKENNTLKSN